MTYEFRPYINDAIEEIDAGIFSGDAFGKKEARTALREVMARWERGLASTDKMDEEWEVEQAALQAAVMSATEAKKA